MTKGSDLPLISYIENSNDPEITLKSIASPFSSDRRKPMSASSFSSTCPDYSHPPEGPSWRLFFYGECCCAPVPSRLRPWARAAQVGLGPTLAGRGGHGMGPPLRPGSVWGVMR